MKDADKRLDELLKRGRVPERSEGYWEAFPKRVTAQLTAGARSSATAGLRHSWSWGLAFATVCLGIALGVGLWLQARRPAAVNYAKLYREVAAMFPNQVRAIVLDGGDVRLELSEQANVPPSMPLRVDVCRDRQCRTYITFSGQQIRVGGERCDVLSDGLGHVLVVGRSVVWTSAEPAHDVKPYHIAAAALGAS